jgi:hypothetical protein
MSVQMIAAASLYTIDIGDQEVWIDWVHYIAMNDWTTTLKQHMAHLAMLDTSLTTFQPQCDCNAHGNPPSKS